MLRDLAPDEGRVGRGVAADEKEGRLNALRLEGVEDLRCRRRRWAIVEREHDLVIIERQRLRIGFQAEFRRTSDLEGATSAERVRVGAGRRRGGVRRSCRSCRRDGKSEDRSANGNHAERLSGACGNPMTPFVPACRAINGALPRRF